MPTGAFHNNLRAILSKKAWDFIRKDAYDRAGHKCSVCGCKAKRLEAHERWSFDIVKKIQKLEDVIAVCHSCHSVIHINRAHLTGDIDRAIEHFKRVNGCGHQGYIKALSEANSKSVELSCVGEWALDVGWLERFIDEKGAD